jgi:membrane-bound serine protease (ClpP class)
MAAGDAFILVLLGAVGLYVEFIRPGRVVPGLTGSLLAVAGMHGLAGAQLNRTGIAVTVIAAALFLIEAFWRIDFLAGLGGTAALTVGCCILVQQPARLSPALTIPACIVCGSATTFLCWQGKRARRNKWQDLSDGAPAIK